MKEKHFYKENFRKITGKRNLKVLFVTFCLVCFSFGNIAAQDVRLNLNLRNVSVSEVFKAIKDQTQMSVVYSNTDIDPDKKVTVRVTNEELGNVLKSILQDSDLTYNIENNYIVLSAKNDQAAQTSAQKDLVVSGTVTDITGEPLIGVNVAVEGKSIGTVTDFDGKYNLTVPAGNNLLSYSYIGYIQQVIPVNQRTSINIVLKEDAKILDEVVVTAMGIVRESKSLTYATQTVKGEELTRAKDANFINSLQGKSAGLTITPNSGGAGSASKILLRGYTSIMGNNSPLIVVDGIPMENKVDGQFNGHKDSGYTMAYSATNEGSDALSNINADDIENISILKGANAAALYGKNAGNGVIIITTKKGKAGKIKVDVSSSTTFETPIRGLLPKLQNTYGGQVGLFVDPRTGEIDYSKSTLTATSWGKKLSDQTSDELAMSGITNRAHDIRDFFQWGNNFNNSVSVSGGNEKMQSYFSYGNTTARGIIPNNKFSRHNVSFRQSFNLINNKLKIEVSANYVHQTANNRTSGGTVYNPLYNLYLAPRNVDMDYYKTYEKEGTWDSERLTLVVPDPNDPNRVIEQAHTIQYSGQKQNWFAGKGTPGENNPYWLINRVTNEKTTKQYWASASATYTIMKGLSAQVRFKYDGTDIRGDEKKYATTVIREGNLIDRGEYVYTDVNYYNTFLDGLINFDREFGDFKVSANVGGSRDVRKGEDLWMWNGGPSAKAYYTKEDLDQLPKTINYFFPHSSYRASRSYYLTSDWALSVFGAASIGYKDIAYLDGTYRVDWTRVYTQFKEAAAFLNNDINPYFDYYSIGGNVLLNSIWDFGEKVNLLKLRASYSNVGNSLPDRSFAGQGSNAQTGEINAVEISPDFNPVPEYTSSFEAGFDAAFFRNTLDFNFSFYNANSINQYLEMPSSVGQTRPVNSGKIRNRGFESAINYNFMISRDFYWKTGFNFSYNNNKILKTYQGSDNIYINIGTSNNIKVRFREGGSYGDIYGYDFARYSQFDEEAGLGTQGDIKLDPQGNPMLASREGDKLLGNINANVRMGWHNTFEYKGFSLYFLIDGKIGGKVISFTEAYLDARGVSERSGAARDSENGLVQMPDGNYASATNYYRTIGEQIFPTQYIYDATNFRLREFSFGYSFRKLPDFLQAASISFVGRNLFFLYNKAPVDPDVSQSTANGLSGVDIFTLPTTRSFGINLKLSF